MTAAASNDQPQEHWLGRAAALSALIIALATAWLYLVGWSYTYQYFNYFGIPLMMVNIPREYYLVYALNVLKDMVWWIVSGILLLAAVLFAFRWLPPRFRPWRSGIGLAAVMGVFLLGPAAGSSVALDQVVRQRMADYPAFPRIQVWIKEVEGAGQGARPSVAGLAAGCYRLVLHNQDRLFLIRPFREARAVEVPTLIVPWDDVAAVRILPDDTSCPQQPTQ